MHEIHGSNPNIMLIQPVRTKYPIPVMRLTIPDEGSRFESGATPSNLPAAGGVRRARSTRKIIIEKNKTLAGAEEFLFLGRLGKQECTGWNNLGYKIHQAWRYDLNVIRKRKEQ